MRFKCLCQCTGANVANLAVFQVDLSAGVLAEPGTVYVMHDYCTCVRRVCTCSRYPIFVLSSVTILGSLQDWVHYKIAK